MSEWREVAIEQARTYVKLLIISSSFEMATVFTGLINLKQFIVEYLNIHYFVSLYFSAHKFHLVACAVLAEILGVRNYMLVEFFFKLLKN